MGLIGTLFNTVFGGGRNAIVETVGVFQENSDSAAQRARDIQVGAMAQFGEEFERRQRGLFDRVMDGVNRVPRPAMAMGCLGLFIAAMVDPIWFSLRMQGIGLVPEPLWWLLGVIVSFYFGARHQAKGQEFQQSIAETMARTPQVMANISALEEIRAGKVGAGQFGEIETRTTERLAVLADPNAALDAWRRSMPAGATVPLQEQPFEGR